MGSRHTNSSVFHKGLKNVYKATSAIEVFLLILAGASLLLILGSIIYGVISRSFFNVSVLWVNDLAGYLALYLVFLSAPWVLKQGGHVQVDLITANLKGKSLKVNSFIITLISGISCALFCWFSLKMTFSYYQKDIVIMQSVSWPKFILIAPIAVGSLFLVIRFCVIMLQLFNRGNLENDDINENSAI